MTDPTPTVMNINPHNWQTHLIRPGDIVALITSGHIDEDALAQLRHEAEEGFPGIKFAVFDGIDAALVYRPNACICTPVPNGITIDPICPQHGSGAAL